MSYVGAERDRARAIKVDRLIGALRQTFGETPLPEVVERLSDDAWRNLEIVAGTRPASETTRAMVIDRLQIRARRANADPFEGFPQGPGRTGR